MDSVKGGMGVGLYLLFFVSLLVSGLLWLGQ